MEYNTQDNITTPEVVVEPKKVYPMVEEMTFRSPVKSEEEAYKLLIAIQTLVNEIGSLEIISMFDYFVSNPSAIAKARKYLPYIKMLG